MVKKVIETLKTIVHDTMYKNIFNINKEIKLFQSTEVKTILKCFIIKCKFERNNFSYFQTSWQSSLSGFKVVNMGMRVVRNSKFIAMRTFISVLI